MIECIDSILDDGKPFLAWVGYQAMHYPYQAPKELIDKYDSVYDEGFDGDGSSMGQKGVYADYGPGWVPASAVPGNYFKTFSTEGGLRVPLIVRFPTVVEPGSQVDSFAYVRDIMPTILEIARVDIPGPIYKDREIYVPDGISILSVLKAETTGVRGEDAESGSKRNRRLGTFRLRCQSVRVDQPR